MYYWPQPFTTHRHCPWKERNAEYCLLLLLWNTFMIVRVVSFFFYRFALWTGDVLISFSILYSLLLLSHDFVSFSIRTTRNILMCCNNIIVIILSSFFFFAIYYKLYTLESKEIKCKSSVIYISKDRKVNVF